jgi:hypothetical protein
MSRKMAKSAKPNPTSMKVIGFDEAAFAEIYELISASHERAFLATNTVLIDL